MTSRPSRLGGAGRQGPAQLASLAVWIAIAAAWGAAAQEQGSGGSGWVRGRATYYGAPKAFAEKYDVSRGEGSFGILAYGACGYTDLPGGTLPFARDAVAASADTNPDYPGSCGRCYDVRCVPGPVLGNDLQPLRIVYPESGNASGNGSNPSGVAYFDGDYARPYLPSINREATDSQGRPFPGNAGEAQGLLDVKCYDKTLRVRIVDSCPCTQVLPEGAPGVKAGGEVRRQEWCCGGDKIPHFDVSYDAFEQLAHPLFGAFNMEFRPVDCDLGFSLPRTYVSSTIYSSASGIQPGWGWVPYDSAAATLTARGPLPRGGTGASTCATISPKGGLSFRCRQCSRPGFQPFAGKTTLSFWIRPDTGTTDPFASSTPAGQVPGLKVFVLEDEPEKRYCVNELVLGNSTAALPAAQQGGWFLLQIPLSAFDCPGNGYASYQQLERLDFQNVAERDARVCLTDIALT